MRKRKIDFKTGISWTIDTPYRETKKEVREYKKQNVSTVEMEASALFTLAKYRNVKMAGAFIVSDFLSEEKWDPKFHDDDVKSKLNQLLDAGIECLRGLR